MEMPMTETGDQAAIAAADHPDIRLFHVTHAKAAQPAADVDATWRLCTPESVASFSAPLYFFGRRLQEELKVPVGLIGSAWGGSPIEQWTPSPEPTGEMYNGMIAPLRRFSIRGVVWYQGEANVNRNEGMHYARQMETLISGWRGAWQRDLPFYFVQIAPWDYSGYLTERVAEMRETQASCMKIPNTGMVVTTDLIEPAGVADGHPRNKRDVGERLARWALAKTYGREDVAYSGPIFKEFKIEGDKIRLSFDYAHGLKTADGEPLREFEISGANGHFAVATAVIDGESVVLSSPLVPTPVQARFAWRNLTRPNLVNDADLPAVPFRTTADGRAE
jgi:sialate O-acetylesterase